MAAVCHLTVAPAIKGEEGKRGEKIEKNFAGNINA